MKCGENLGVGDWAHLVAVGVDVPDSRDAGGEGCFGGFGECDLGET